MLRGRLRALEQAALRDAGLTGMDACALLQVHIKHVGTASMLFNGEELAGIATKIQRLASRERTISLANEDPGSLERELRRFVPAGPGPQQARLASVLALCAPQCMEALPLDWAEPCTCS